MRSIELKRAEDAMKNLVAGLVPKRFRKDKTIILYCASGGRAALG